MICSTQMSAFDVPRDLRVKLHVPLGYWIKLVTLGPRVRCTRVPIFCGGFIAIAKSTLYEIFYFVLNRLYLRIQRTEKLYKGMSTGYFWVPFRSVSVIVWNTYHVRPGGVCTSRLGSRRPSWMMHYILITNFCALIIIYS